MEPRCLSGFEPCKTICENCVDSYNRGILWEMERKIQGAVNLLKSQGFTVIAPDISDRDTMDGLRILLQTNRIKF